VRPRNLLLFLLLGTCVAVLPAMASSETVPAVEAVSTGQSGGVYSHETFAWAPTQATINAGGSVMFSTGSTSAPHGIVWTSSAKPTCSSTVPVGENNFGEHWSGSCTFTQPGTYTFECSVHHREMTGTITVSATGTTTTMSVPAPTPTPTTTTPTPTPKPVVGPTQLTRAQKLARALRACKKKPKGQRAACRRRAHKRYGSKR
jgi:plastocyanin